MEFPITVPGKKSSKKQILSEAVFDVPYNEGLIHQVVTAYLAGGRAGTKAQKNRSDVSGGGSKPWRQKGTGRARAGTIRSPLWRTGGVTFAAKPRDFTQKVNRKMFQRGIRVILSELARRERLVIVDDIKLTAPKTKELVAHLSELNLDKVLIVTDAIDTNLVLASRNIPNIYVVDAANADPVSLVSNEKVLLTVAAVKKLEERFNEQ